MTNKEILEQLEFIITLDITEKVPEEKKYQITEAGKFSGPKDGVFPLHIFSSKEEKYITSGKVEVYWTYINMHDVEKFKLKEVENVLNVPVLLNKNRVFQVNVGKEILEDIIYRVRFLETLHSTKDMTTWYVIPDVSEHSNFVMDPCLKEHNKE
jgi:hypothetical protein